MEEEFHPLARFDLHIRNLVFLDTGSGRRVGMKFP
jgi:hypothetical protein